MGAKDNTNYVIYVDHSGVHCPLSECFHSVSEQLGYLRLMGASNKIPHPWDPKKNRLHLNLSTKEGEKKENWMHDVNLSRLLDPLLARKHACLRATWWQLLGKINIPVPDTGSCLLMDVRAIRLQEETWKNKPAAPVNEKHSDVVTVEVPGFTQWFWSGYEGRGDSPVSDGDASAGEFTDRTKQLICVLSPSRLPHSQCLQCC